MSSAIEIQLSTSLGKYSHVGNNFGRTKAGESLEHKVCFILTCLQNKFNEWGAGIPNNKRKCKKGLPIYGVHVPEMVQYAIIHNVFPFKNRKEIEQAIRVTLSTLKRKKVCDFFKVKDLEFDDSFWPTPEENRWSKFKAKKQNAGWFLNWEDVSRYGEKIWTDLTELAKGNQDPITYLSRYVYR